MEDFAAHFRRQATKQTASTKRNEFIKYWQSLSSVPLMVEPIPKVHSGTTKSEDAIRVTGSPNFIAAVCARLKDILLFDNPSSKVEITYKRSTMLKSNGQASYNLYVTVHQR